MEERPPQLFGVVAIEKGVFGSPTLLTFISFMHIYDTNADRDRDTQTDKRERSGHETMLLTGLKKKLNAETKSN